MSKESAKTEPELVDYSFKVSKRGEWDHTNFQAFHMKSVLVVVGRCNPL